MTNDIEALIERLGGNLNYSGAMTVAKDAALALRQLSEERDGLRSELKNMIVEYTNLHAASYSKASEYGPHECVINARAKLKGQDHEG